MIPCKICTEPTDMEGTRLCNGCWEALRSTQHMVEALKVDVQISFERFSPFGWTAQLRTDQGDHYMESGQGLEEALERALLKLRAE